VGAVGHSESLVFNRGVDCRHAPDIPGSRRCAGRFSMVRPDRASPSDGLARNIHEPAPNLHIGFGYNGRGVAIGERLMGGWLAAKAFARGGAASSDHDLSRRSVGTNCGVPPMTLGQSPGPGLATAWGWQHGRNRHASLQPADASRRVTLPNRIVISPMQQYSAGPDGLPNEFHRQHYGRLSLGGPGLLFTEALALTGGRPGGNEFRSRHLVERPSAPRLPRSLPESSALGRIPATPLIHSGPQGQRLATLGRLFAA